MDLTNPYRFPYLYDDPFPRKLLIRANLLKVPEQIFGWKTRPKVQRFMSSKELAEVDDLVTSIILDPYLNFKTHKVNLGFTPPKYNAERIHNILLKFVEHRDYERAYDLILQEEWAVDNYFTKDRMLQLKIKQHVFRYLKLLDNKLGACILPCTRYSSDNYLGAKICATKPWRKGDHITHLVGCTVYSKNQKEQVKLYPGQNDFSIIYSFRSSRSQLFLGPVAFVNHDCEPNCEVVPDGRNTAHLKVKRHIDEGEEIMFYYGQNFFGSMNLRCECVTCEKEREGSSGEESDNSVHCSYSLRRRAPRSFKEGSLRKIKYSKQSL